MNQQYYRAHQQWRNGTSPETCRGMQRDGPSIPLLSAVQTFLVLRASAFYVVTWIDAAQTYYVVVLLFSSVSIIYVENALCIMIAYILHD